MAKIQPVWALDIGQAALKALKLVPGDSPDRATAEAFDYIEYPKILSQPDADPEQLVREALETFLERNDLKGSKVAIGVPGQAGLVKFIKLPPVEKKRIPDIVKFEARQQIPFALEEVVWAYQQIGGDAEEDEEFAMAEVGLFAMKRDQINRAILPFRVAGIEVDIVQMGPIALYNFITFDQLREPTPPDEAPAKGKKKKEGEAEAEAEPAAEMPEPPKVEKGHSVVLIDIGADNTDLIITDGSRIWQRNVPIGGNHFTRALTKELKLTFAKAEHLKRNATKAPDPRSIFTAMRGVFNDFASELNRSIGFYTSTNRTAKIAKVIGLGNGFKLPGLQKFLQQNLSFEVEKLEAFYRLVGEDVKTAPQFQENLMSFAVAYGLAVQGLGRGGLSTNLLPPEIEQVRMIRAKKPWALAASTLLMLGFTGLFLGDYRVLAKVSTEQFDQAVKQAKSASETGARYNTEYEAAKGEWNAKFAEGNALVGGTGERATWPNFLKTLNAALLDPVRDYKLDPNKPDDTQAIDRLRVHIDAIKPVWRNDVGADWFNNATVLDERFKRLMIPYDRDTPPSGPGWIVQVVGHHYNPTPGAEDLKPKPGKPVTAFGPHAFLLQKVLPRLMTPEMRLYGVKNVALSWISVDRQWTTEKGAQNNGMSNNPVPILGRATPPAAAPGQPGAEGAPAPGMAGGPGSMMERPQFAMDRGPGMMGPGMGMGMGMGMMGMGGVTGDAAKKMVTQTRTDFLIQFVWQPPKPEEQPKTKEDRDAKLAEIAKKVAEADKFKAAAPAAAPTERDIEAASAKASQEVAGAVARPGPGAPAAGAPAPGAPAAGTPGAPAAGAPAATPAPPATPK
jgi:type IV pilus assembly protein PilM